MSVTSRTPVVQRARWERPAFLGLLLATGVLYIVNLGANGYANAFYSAAVQAGSTNWEAFFYGSSDAGNAITVDKPPAFLWVMELSVRLFGLNSWAILVPEALMGVGAVALLYVIVRRRFSAGSALIAGAAGDRLVNIRITDHERQTSHTLSLPPPRHSQDPVVAAPVPQPGHAPRPGGPAGRRAPDGRGGLRGRAHPRPPEPPPRPAG